MDTSASAQPSKPTFGTSDFAVSTVDSPAYIDATAEETCPAESVPLSRPDEEPQQAADAADASPVVSTEVMDQLKALAQNVTQGDDAYSAQSKESEEAIAGDADRSPAPEPSIQVFPRPAGFENDQTANDRPLFANQALVLAGFVVAVLTGAAGTFAWQAHVKPGDVAMATPPAPAAPVVSPELIKQLDALSQDIGSLRRGVEDLAVKQQQIAAAQQQLEQLAARQQQLATRQDQLAGKQEQVGQSVAKLQALEQARQRTPPPVQARPAPVPPRPSVPPPRVVEQATQPPPPPRTASHPIPPLPIPP